jgi:hypothetical protein
MEYNKTSLTEHESCLPLQISHDKNKGGPLFLLQLAFLGDQLIQKIKMEMVSKTKFAEAGVFF